MACPHVVVVASVKTPPNPLGRLTRKGDQMEQGQRWDHILSLWYSAQPQKYVDSGGGGIRFDMNSTRS